MCSWPLSSLQIFFLLGVRAACRAALAWWQLLKLVVSFHAGLFLQFMLWALAFLTFPVRLLTCLQRERKAERLLHEMQIQMDALVWESKELQDRLEIAYKDRNVMEAICEEIEEDYEKALARIDLLENEMQDLKEENRRLAEGRGKSLWDDKAHDSKDKNVLDALPPRINYDQDPSSWSAPNKSGIIVGDPWDASGKDKSPMHGPSEAAAHQFSSAPPAVSRNLTVDEMFLQRGRVIALYRSVFSAILSVIVGMIVWEAESPCPQLIAALFFVVGMSLCSVVQFFLTIKNKPASDAVALLCINWFILGTLTAPTLPSIAALLVPLADRLAKRALIWL
ncbi:hypothetical protein ACMD2_02494 [Ananas comosus]|uniref:Uncharacterized protein n=1 Tax=Ananas comosus TaxID=4615 RepID=A0A199V932_ANACO|nr:hypothetical protein ACMD2_02494 [Ananas comosus]